MQGTKLKKTAAKPLTKKVNRRGGSSIAPKKSTLIKQAKLQKKLTAGSIKETEKQMAAKAASTGKLTIMKSLGKEAIVEIEKKKKKKTVQEKKIIQSIKSSKKK